MSFSVVGLALLKNKKSESSSLSIGSAPQESANAWTPGVAPRVEWTWRRAARIASGGAFIKDGGRETLKVRTLRALKPGLTSHRRESVRIIRPAPISRT